MRSGDARLADRLGVAVYLAEPGALGRWLYVTQAVTEIFGFSPEELTADPGIWLRHLHPQDRGPVLERESTLADTGRVCSEYRVIRRDGQTVWVLDDAVIEHGADGKALLHGFLLDITERKRTELMLTVQADVVEAVADGDSLEGVLGRLANAVEGLSGGARCTVEVAPTLDADQVLAVSGLGPVAAAGPVIAPEPDGLLATMLEAPLLTASGQVLGRLLLQYAPGRVPPKTDVELPLWAARLASLAVVRAREHQRMASSVALLTATLESTVDGILVVDSTGRVVGHNQTFAQIWRIDPDLLARGDDAALMASVLEQLTDPAGFVAQVNQLYDNPEQTSFDEVSFLDGRVFERYSQPQRVDGQTVGRVWSFRDVSEKRRLRADLRDSEDSLSLLVGQVRDYAMLSLDPTGHVVTWNIGAQRIKGYTQQEILGQHFSAFYTPEDVAADKPAKALEAALAEGHVLDEGWRVRKDGSRFWASVVTTALYDEHGRLRGFGKVTRDVTDRHEAELALHRQARTLELLGRVATASNAAIDVEEALAATLESFSQFGGWQLAHAYLADHDDPSALRHSVWYEQDPGAFTGFISATESTHASEVKLASGVLSSPAPVLLSTQESDQGLGRAAEAVRAGLVSACAFPILVRDQPVGVLEFFSTQAQPSSDDVLEVMHHIGTQLGRVVERDRAELRLAGHTAQLGRMSKQLETVLNSAGEGIYGVDARGRVTFINDAGARLLGMPRADLVGRLADEVIQCAPDPGPAQPNPQEGLSAGGVPRLVTGQHRRADGTLFDSESISAPIAQDGALSGSVVVFRDISDRRAVERMKDQFISVVSHELRTPLTAIRGALGLLGGGAAGRLPPHAVRMVDVATTSSDRLIRLITDILDLERMAAGQMPLRPRQVKASDLIAKVVEESEGLVAATSVNIVVGDTPGSVFADPDRIVQVLTNLVGNAVKFSRPGSSVKLRTSVLDHHVRFDVQDHGVGLPLDQLELIFEPFRQGDASDTRRHGGSGLGLAICRGLVEQHHGKIWATSKPEGGATFSFTLPREDRPHPL